jgi:hypothetical protein
MSTWKIFSTIMSKKASQVQDYLKGAQKPEPVDRNLPLGIYIGATVELDETPFILGGAALKIKMPGDRNTVEAYGLIRSEDNLTVHRFYLRSLAGDEESVLQVATDRDGAIEECRLFRSFDQIFPRLVEDWDFWLNRKEGYIGWPAFESKDDKTSYARVWFADDPNHVEGVKLTETIFFDRYGQQSATVKQTAMLYGRWVNEKEQVAEYMLVAMEEHSPREALINILVGIDLMPLALKII